MILNISPAGILVHCINLVSQCHRLFDVLAGHRHQHRSLALIASYCLIASLEMLCLPDTESVFLPVLWFEVSGTAAIHALT